jgi:uncharacterized protein (TIGR03118 family)
MRTLIRRMRRAWRGRRQSPRSRSYRPTLETLEGRSVPAAAGFKVTNLVSDQPGVAQITDPDLVNAWGIAQGPRTAFWVSDNNAIVNGQVVPGFKTTLYAGDVNGSPFFKVPLTVAMPNMGSPTGQVFNTTNDFILSDGSKALFIFADENGQIDAWNGGLNPITNAELKATVAGADFTGITIDNILGHNVLLAVDNASGNIDAFDSSFHQITLPPSLFHDPKVPSDFHAYDIQNLGSSLGFDVVAVSYARNDIAPGFGIVGLFSGAGQFLGNLPGNFLSAPWAMTFAPSNFGPFSNDLLVGNLDSGWIAAFDVRHGHFVDFLRDTSGNIIQIDGLWGLHFGNGTTAGDSNALYFSSGPDFYSHGLFGSIRFVSGTSPTGGSMTTHTAATSSDGMAMLAHAMMSGAPATTPTPSTMMPPPAPHGSATPAAAAATTSHPTMTMPDSGAHSPNPAEALTQAIDQLFASL